MKTKFMIVKLATLAAMTSLLAGCYTPDGTPNNTANGALIGAGAGAALGAVADRRFPGAGALFGAAAGGLTGALIGNSVDRENARRTPPPPPPDYVPETTVPALSLEDIKNMTHSGVSDDVIINQVITSHTVYELSSDTIVDLNKAGVSQRVITCLINSANTNAAPAPQPPPTYAAPSPEAVWIDGQWTWNGWVWVDGRWVWPPFPHAHWVRAHQEWGPYGWQRVPGYWH